MKHSTLSIDPFFAITFDRIYTILVGCKNMEKAPLA